MTKIDLWDCRRHGCCDRVVARICTDHTRPMQYHVREAYCGGRGQKEAIETKAEMREEGGGVEVRKSSLPFI